MTYIWLLNNKKFELSPYKSIERFRKGQMIAVLPPAKLIYTKREETKEELLQRLEEHKLKTQQSLNQIKRAMEIIKHNY